MTRKARNIVVLTGAGISAESGISTFRDEGGLWCNHRIEDVATPEGFARNPALVHQFYSMRRAQLREVQPNAAHTALAEFACNWPGKMLLVTQNVDDLHARAFGSKTAAPGFRLIAMHGELKKLRCSRCHRVADWEDDSTTHTFAECCGDTGLMRPHIVWFGEMPFALDEIYAALAECDLFLSIGTSGNVYPAAGFVQAAKMEAGAHTVELNLEPSLGATLFDETLYGKAGTIVPEYLAQVEYG